MFAEIALRNLHQTPAPSWWPPAPGWWWLAAAVIGSALLALWWRHRRQRQRATLVALFDDALRRAETPAQRVAVMSELLRRAARRIDPAADRLEGEAWLALLDLGADGTLLLDGAYRPAVSAQAVAALQPKARARFLQWMDAR